MKKQELVEKMAAKTEIPKARVQEMMEAFEEIVTKTLADGGEVTMTGFGTFKVSHRKARTGVNPQRPTEKISIPAVTVPKFKAGKSLKDAVKKQ
ncbi:MAG: HU family DNA-binding protein [Patescibacteria group bacterium]|nr:HU family DNA-binding protein [Patescibacteria group bacterium]TSC52912.1 MAG: DNA-binding protein HU-beta [Parcubacteria group bacterium LiPW_72]